MFLGEEFEGIIEKLIFGGKGLLRHPSGMCIHVMGVLPQEKVFVRITKVHKRYAEADLVSVVELSKGRIVPKCRHFGLCGGCQLQHMTYEMQTDSKHAWLKENLQGLYDDEVLWSPSSCIWHFRKKIVLHATKDQAGNVLLGYFGKSVAGTTLFSCHECPIFFEMGEEVVLESIQEALAHITHWRSADVVLFRRPSGKISVQFLLDRRGKSTQVLVSPYIEEAHILFHGELLETLIACPKRKLSLDVQGLSFLYSEESFVQTHPEQPGILWQDFVAHMNRTPKRILDLYSGIGVTALLAAQRGHTVTAVEVSQEAVRVCQETAKKYGISSFQVVLKPVERCIRTLAPRADIIVVNPPRRGMACEVVQEIARSSAQEIHYISCQPATLRRDLQLLSDRWKVVWAKGYDMFPQTTHFETYVRLCASSSQYT